METYRQHKINRKAVCKSIFVQFDLTLFIVNHKWQSRDFRLRVHSCQALIGLTRHDNVDIWRSDPSARIVPLESCARCFALVIFEFLCPSCRRASQRQFQQEQHVMQVCQANISSLTSHWILHSHFQVLTSSLSNQGDQWCIYRDCAAHLYLREMWRVQSSVCECSLGCTHESLRVTMRPLKRSNRLGCTHESRCDLFFPGLIATALTNSNTLRGSVGRTVASSGVPSSSGPSARREYKDVLKSSACTPTGFFVLSLCFLLTIFPS